MLLQSFSSYKPLVGARVISSRGFGEDVFSPSIPIKGKFMMQNNTRSFMYGHFCCINLPDAVDWRKKGAVTAVKNQGRCDCCWIFAAIAAVEGMVMIKKKKLIRLSEQELLDCITTNFRNKQIVGGRIEWAFEYIMKYGVTLEAKYPYTAVKGYCKKIAPVVAIDGFEYVPADEDSLLKAVANQPVAIAIASSCRHFAQYKGGIFMRHCDEKLDHAMTLVGYGEEDETKYWIAKNSWGKKWGEKGYMRLLRGVSYPGGICGLAWIACYPIKISSNLI